jgi:hypothetical protein
MKFIILILRQEQISASKNEIPVPVSSHNSRAASATVSSNQSNSNNQDMVFIPPKTPVRSKTRDNQYTTPSKLVSKSGNLNVLTKFIFIFNF